MKIDGIRWINIFGYCIAHNTRNGNWYFLKKEDSVFSMMIKNANGVSIHKAFKNLKEATKYILQENNSNELLFLWKGY